MGSGANIVLFDPSDSEVMEVQYVRVKKVAYFSDPITDYEEIYEEGPFDFALSES